jgi:hypothetical protein
LVVSVFILHRAIPNRGGLWRPYLDFIGLWSELDRENYRINQELVFSVFIINGTIPNRGGFQR